ncbi:MAG: hypothetical protein QGG40_21340, partial [Myxococcota bacterium]|nr:hypothetical protein [Myxococcota bacterium]
VWEDMLVAVGAVAHMRPVIAEVEDLAFYPAVGGGIVTAQSADDVAMLPLLELGLGFRVLLDDNPQGDRTYFGFEFGLADFAIGYMNLSVSKWAAR